MGTAANQRVAWGFASVVGHIGHTEFHAEGRSAGHRLPLPRLQLIRVALHNHKYFPSAEPVRLGCCNVYDESRKYVFRPRSGGLCPYGRLVSGFCHAISYQISKVGEENPFGAILPSFWFRYLVADC